MNNDRGITFSLQDIFEALDLAQRGCVCLTDLVEALTFVNSVNSIEVKYLVYI